MSVEYVHPVLRTNACSNVELEWKLLFNHNLIANSVNCNDVTAGNKTILARSFDQGLASNKQHTASTLTSYNRSQQMHYKTVLFPTISFIPFHRFVISYFNGWKKVSKRPVAHNESISLSKRARHN